MAEGFQAARRSREIERAHDGVPDGQTARHFGALARPQFAGAFQMIQISSTGLPHADRARLENSVRALGGAYAGDLTDRTTHLVATKIHPRSAKLACALKLGLPIVLPQWVHASGTAGEPLPLGPHHVPPALSGVVLAAAAAAAAPPPPPPELGPRAPLRFDIDTDRVAGC